MEEEEALPDHLRCKRTDGRQWRCTRRVMENKKLCELHYLQGRHRQNKEKVPGSLKLQRKKRNKTVNQDCESRNPEIRAKRAAKLAKPMKRRGSVRVSEALDKALKKMKLKKGDLQLELIRVFLQRQVERRKMRRLIQNIEGELVRELPNGLMAISQAPLQHHIDNAGSQIKLGVDLGSDSGPQRCFRSKNIEPLPIGSLQVVPYGRNVRNLKIVRGKKCHLCRKRKRHSQSMIKCSSCQKEYFCMDCIKQRYFNIQDVRMACPVCRGTCSCKACMINQSKDVECKDFLRDQSRVEKILQLHYLICMLLPVLEQINQDQRIELEIEAKIRGELPSEVLIQQVEFGHNKQSICNNCKTSIVDFHRSCPHCSYNLCLTCCWEFFRGVFPGGNKSYISKYYNRWKAYLCDDQPLQEMKQLTSVGSTRLASCTSFHQWKACNDDGSISCPPTEFGGCGDGHLDLRCVFPSSWTKQLEISAEEIVCSYEFPEILDVSSPCSLCIGMDHEIGKIKELQEAANREDSNDNFLYYPTVQGLHDDNLEHFQKHWGRGHPIIVRNVLQGMSDLSWDPIVMFCTYLERSSAKSENDKKAVKATSCLDWCEVEIDIKQFFMGSLEGRKHTNAWQEKLKLKGWLSSHLFQEQFPTHYDEIIHSLPLQEYMNPKSGLLNLAVKLPHEYPKPDLGPCIYISYGSCEELLLADSVTRLSYESYDVVNILAYATDVPISTEKLSKIRKLLKKHKAQDHSKPTRIAIDSKAASQVNRASSLFSQNMDEARLQDRTRERPLLCNGVSTVPWFSAARHDTCDVSVQEGNIASGEELNSESDSEAAKLSCGTSKNSTKSGGYQKLCQEHMKSSNCLGRKLVANSCGAQWDVFRRQDVPKLLEYLREHSNEFGHIYGLSKHVVHPILDKSFFLDANHKMQLKEKFKIEPWTFEQHLGEAVMIPAGCPYQIRNLKSCVNVVLDFISPENVSESIRMIDELRLLPQDHKAKEDNLEVKKMTLYSINTAIKEIQNLTCAETRIELKD